MEQQENIYVEEQGANFLDVLKVLFGRPLLLLIITFGVAFVGTAGAFLYNSFTKTYESRFHFSEDELNGNEPKNLNETKFEIRNYFGLDALLSYKDSDESLANLNADKAIENNGVEELKWDVIEEFNRDTNTSRILQQDYKVIFKKSNFSFDEAKAVVKNATDKVISDNVKLLNEIDRNEYLDLYRSALLFEDKVNNLDLQFDYILERYDDLLNRFGNVKALGDKEGLISEFRNEVAVDHQNTSFEGYLKEIDNKALVYNKEQTISLLEAQIEDITLELKYTNDEKDDLVAQRNAIIAASDGKLTLDLESYNSKIVELTEKTYNLEKQKEIINKKISIINSNNASEKAQNEQYVAEFTAKLEALATKLDKYVNDLRDIEVYQYRNNMRVYFDTTAIIKVVNKISVIRYALISLGLGFVAALITNLCLDGKKLTKEYRKEHEKK